MTDTPKPLRRIPIVATLIVVLAAAIMVALGVWQLQRKGEKDALIALLDANAANPALVTFPELPPVPDALLFRKSSVVCLEPVHWDSRGGADRDGKIGYRLVADCRTGAEGPGVLVDMGVSDGYAPPDWSGGTVTGMIVPGPHQPTIIARLTGQAAPPRAMLLSDDPAPGLRASAAPTPEDIPNNHLAYAVQWFLFAAIALVIYGLAIRRRLQG